MKKLQNLVGVKILSKKDQKAVKGGIRTCGGNNDCGDIPGWECVNGHCKLIMSEDKAF